MAQSKPTFEPTPAELKWIDRFSKFLDSKFKIPGTDITFGIDPIIGLIPVAGDVSTFGISGLLILSMIRNGASREVVIRMLFNVGLDALVGMVPILGSLFDVYYKANRRNYKLLTEHQVEGKHDGNGWGLLIGAAAVLLVMFMILLVGLVAVTKWVIGFF